VIVFDLQCTGDGHVFEAWFRSGADFDEQSAKGLVQCPLCGSAEVAKAPMAPSVARKNNMAGASPVEMLARLQAEVLRDSEWVGDRFADEARAMHLGDAEPRAVHGQATPDQASSLVEDGVPIAPLPLPLVPPGQVN
jgi:hypothetical protein